MSATKHNKPVYISTTAQPLINSLYTKLINNTHDYNSTRKPTTNKTIKAFADTGANGNFFKYDDSLHLKRTTNPVVVRMPNQTKISSSHQSTINLHTITPIINQHFQKLDKNLLGVGEFCDRGCTAIFEKDRVIIKKKGNTILQGPRDQQTKLWTLDVPITNADEPNDNTSIAPQVSNNVLQMRNKKKIIMWMHQTLFSPSVSTLRKAIQRKYLVAWPGLDDTNILKHLPASPATAKGHLDQCYKNTRSTKSKPATTTEEDANTTFPEATEESNHLIFAMVEELHNTNTTYSDLTGRFPSRSSQGNQYFLIVYAYDPNLIWGVPIKNRSSAQILEAHDGVFKLLQDAGCTPTEHHMDNEAPAILKEALTKSKIKYQLVPAHQHRRNAAERAIRTWKNHFISGLCTVNNKFPMHLYDRLTNQCNITLNLLRGSRINPKLSAYAQIFGQYDYNQAPMAPPGTRVIAHEKPTQRRTWDPHGADGWYLGPAQEHYRCYKIYITKTGGERICDTVSFFPSDCESPIMSTKEAIVVAAQELTKALKTFAPTFCKPNDINDLQQLNEIFNPNDQTQGVTDKSKVKSNNNTPAQNIPPSPQHRYPTRSTIRLHGHNMFKTAAQAMEYTINAVLTEEGKQLEYKHLINDPETAPTWNPAAANEFGRLAQGVGGRINGTNTVRFIHKREIPKGKRPTYARFVCDIRPHKTEKYRVRMTVGGNLIEYPFSVYTRTTDIVTAKILFNSVLSTPGAKFLTMDIKNYYLNTPMDMPEYMKIHISLIPEEIMKEYNLHDYVDNDGFVYMEILKGMCGLRQAGKLSYDHLVKNLAPHGY